MTVRKYRTKVEVLRDVLEASRKGSKKTRIIGLANLNRSSFESYVTFCLKNDLLVERNGGYETTTRAEETLATIEIVLTKASELDAALRALGQLVSARSGVRKESGKDNEPLVGIFGDRLLAGLDPLDRRRTGSVSIRSGTAPRR